MNDDTMIEIDYDDIIRQIKSEYSRERNKTEELATFLARVIALLTLAKEDHERRTRGD